MEFVYHASKTHNLKVLEPQVGTHGKPWVYALKELELTALFIGNNFDFINQIDNFDDGRIYIFERFENSLEHAFKGISGSIYKLDAKNFLKNQTSWEKELVSTYTEIILEEIYVEDAYEFLIQLEKENKLTIYRFPFIPEGYPKDKSDLVEKAVKFFNVRQSENVLNQVKRYHPDILETVVKRLKSSGVEFNNPEWIEYASKV